MKSYLDLERFPLHRPESAAYSDLVARCRADLAQTGMFNLEGFLRPGAASAAAKAVEYDMAHNSFAHSRQHNVYFKKIVDGIGSDHPALKLFDTINHTLCTDQLDGNIALALYEWRPLTEFLAKTMGKPEIFQMQDPIARMNIMAYREGEALNWHFDRSEFTTTLLLQAPEAGGEFEFRTGLRTPQDPNYDGVAKLLAGNDPEIQRISPAPGTLNVFQGVNTPHRVTPIIGKTERVIAVFSYYDRPGVMFSPEERLGFYGRTE